MNLLKVFLVISLFIGTAAACEEPFEVDIHEGQSNSSDCKDLILKAMQIHKCSDSSIKEVEKLTPEVSSMGGATSLCFLPTDFGDFVVVDDSINDSIDGMVSFAPIGE